MVTLIAILILIVLATMLSAVLLNRRPARTHHSRAGVGASAPVEGDVGARRQLEASGRERAVTTRGTFGRLLGRDRAQLARREPVTVTDEAIGVTRRELFNRSLLVVVGFALAGAGSAVLAFLWPSGASAGFGGKVKVSGLAKVLAQIEQKRTPFYVSAARTWLQRYPPNALPAAKKVYEPVIYAGMQRGVVAMYQRCPHLGCRVPWCQSSQWFECPCHGSKYNAVGEKKAGPAPRGMDRFAIEFSGDDITINTETVILGPPIGTNTTGQQAEGPLCV